MAEIAVGGAINEGFSLIRRHPGAVLLWGLTQVALTVIIFALYTPVYASMFAAMRAGGPAAVQAINPQLMQMQSFSYLLQIIQIATSSVIWCAAFRAVLHPQSGRFGFLRLGASEFFIAILLIGGSMGFGLAVVFAALVVGIVVGLFAVMHLIWAAVLVGVLATLALLVAGFYVALRFSMVGPMIVDDGKFHLGESWSLTRGHVGSLFLIFLLLMLVALAGEIVLGILLVAIGAGGLAAIAGGLHNLPVFFQQPPQVIVARLAPLLAIAALLWIPFFGCLLAVMAAPWARAYRDLQPPDVAATFA